MFQFLPSGIAGVATKICMIFPYLLIFQVDVVYTAIHATVDTARDQPYLC